MSLLDTLSLFYVFYHFSKEKQRALTNELEQSKENHVKILQKKDAELEELNNIKDQQSHQLAEMRLTVKSLQSSLTTETQRYVKYCISTSTNYNAAKVL